VASGAADQAGSPLTDTSRFRIASVTKPIVAALVLDAVDRGELALDDAVGSIVPGAVRATPVIAVRQLLDHSSGVFDEGNEGDPIADIEQLSDPALRDEARRLLARFDAGEGVVTPARLIVALAETHQRYFPPGTGYHYSNANYQLAGMVLEAATGQSLADLLRIRVVEPLGLSHTSMAPDDTRSPEMHGYELATAGADPVDRTDDLSWFGNAGSGGIVSTPDEVLTILQAIVTGQLFPDPLVADMIEGGPDSYGLGLGSYPFRCGTFYGHNGLVDGTQTTAVVSRDGADGLVVVLNQANGDDPGLTGLAESMLCPVP
jgi:D-alanyl-D-alanine carboxypeptidase